MRLEGFPKDVTLRDGTGVVVRQMTPEDGLGVHHFFAALPEEDRQYLRDDVTKREWAERFVANIDHDSAIPLVAERSGVVIGVATLYRTRHGWTKHVAQIRVSVARPFQRQGLGTALARILVRTAIGLGLEKMVIQVVENQVAAVKAFERLGFKKEAVLRGHVKDVFGIKRNLVVMSNDVSHLWEAMESLVADFQPALE